MGIAGRLGLGIAAFALGACSRSAPEPSKQAMLETVVVELKDVPPPAEAPKPPVVERKVVAEQPRPETPQPTTQVKSRVKSRPTHQTSHAAVKPTQPETKPPPPETKPDPPPPKPDNKPPLETNPYIYK